MKFEESIRVSTRIEVEGKKEVVEIEDDVLYITRGSTDKMFINIKHVDLYLNAIKEVADRYREVIKRLEANKEWEERRILNAGLCRENV